MYTELLEWGIPALIFVTVASGFYSLLSRQLEGKPKAYRPGDELLLHSDDRLRDWVLGDLTPALAAQIPVTNNDRPEVSKELRTAGYYGPTAILEYAAVRAVLVIIPLIATGLIALMVDNSQMHKVLIGGLITAMLGYSLPRLYLHWKGKERIRKLENALPVTVDMLTLCMTGGQTLQASLDRVSREVAAAHPLMAAELSITRQHAELSSLPHALKQLAERVPVGEVRHLALILAQAEKLGSETSQALLEFANHLRTTLKKRADSKANQAMFWMLFPTILCLWIPAAILLVGPAILEFRTQRQTIFQEWKESRQKVRQANQAPAAIPASPGNTPSNTVAARE